MELIGSFAIIAFAGLIHASFQLSVSVLTLLSGHAIGTKTSHAKLLRLTGSFLLGAAIMTILLLSFISLVVLHVFDGEIPLLMWAVASGLLLGLGVAVWAFYYRKEQGTSLWLPRGLARYLTQRTKATKHAAESFGLGLSSVIAELIFIFAPLLITALILTQLEPMWQLAGIATYAFISLLTLLIVTALIGGGHKLSRIQKWREANKRFLQFAAGSGLLVLGFYIYVSEVVATSAAHGAF